MSLKPSPAFVIDADITGSRLEHDKAVLKGGFEMVPTQLVALLEQVERSSVMHYEGEPLQVPDGSIIISGTNTGAPVILSQRADTLRQRVGGKVHTIMFLMQHNLADDEWAPNGRSWPGRLGDGKDRGYCTSREENFIEHLHQLMGENGHSTE